MDAYLPGPSSKRPKHAATATEISARLYRSTSRLSRTGQVRSRSRMPGRAPRRRQPTSSRWRTGRIPVGYQVRASGMMHNWSPSGHPSGFQRRQSRPGRHDPVPHGGQHRLLRFARHGHRPDRGNHGRAPPGSGECRSGIDSTSGTRGHHDWWCPCHRRSRHSSSRPVGETIDPRPYLRFGRAISSSLSPRWCGARLRASTCCELSSVRIRESSRLLAHLGRTFVTR